MGKEIGVDFGVSAKAEATLQVTADIPPASSGRLLDALTDIIRPFSERRGLRADQIRLQREDVLIEIFKKAKLRSEKEGISLAPVQNKFLVPFLEKASNEEMQSELLSTWVQLLISAASSPVPISPRFVSVLSELRAIDCQVLKLLTTSARNGSRIELIEDACDNLTPLAINHTIQKLWEELMYNPQQFDQFANTLVAKIEIPGGILRSIDIETSAYSLQLRDAQPGYKDSLLHPIIENPNLVPCLAVLESLGLVHSYLETIRLGKPTKIVLGVTHLTVFGRNFLIACDDEIRQAVLQSHGSAEICYY